MISEGDAQDGVCDACGFDGRVKRHMEHGAGLWLCWLCANSPSGGAALALSYRPDGAVLRMTAYCTNLILKKLGSPPGF